MSTTRTVPGVPEELESVDIQGSHFWVRKGTSDRGILGEVHNHRAYALSHVKDPKCIIDIGAHIGGFTIRAANMFPKARVRGYEAYLPSRVVASVNLQSQDKPLRATIRHAAVIGNHVPSGYVRTWERYGNNDKINYGGGRIHVDHLFPVKNKDLIDDVPIPVVRVENVVKKAVEEFGQIDVLKMDCEGSEHDILDVLERAKLLTSIQNIIVEIHSWNDIHIAYSIMASIERQFKRSLKCFPPSEDVTTLMSWALQERWRT